MTQYIDKDALVAQIERIKEDALQKKGQCKRRGLERIMHQIGAYNKILSFLNTLEVKEVDFDAEWKRYFEHRGEMATVNVKHLAKHFFELGLRSTITEEDCKLIWNIGDEIPCMSEEEFFKELLKRYKAQNGE